MSGPISLIASELVAHRHSGRCDASDATRPRAAAAPPRPASSIFCSREATSGGAAAAGDGTRKSGKVLKTHHEAERAPYAPSWRARADRRARLELIRRPPQSRRAAASGSRLRRRRRRHGRGAAGALGDDGRSRRRAHRALLLVLAGAGLAGYRASGIGRHPRRAAAATMIPPPAAVSGSVRPVPPPRRRRDPREPRLAARRRRRCRRGAAASAAAPSCGEARASRRPRRRAPAAPSKWSGITSTRRQALGVVQVLGPRAGTPRRAPRRRQSEATAADGCTQRRTSCRVRRHGSAGCPAPASPSKPTGSRAAKPAAIANRSTSVRLPGHRAAGSSERAPSPPCGRRRGAGRRRRPPRARGRSTRHTYSTSRPRACSHTRVPCGQRRARPPPPFGRLDGARRGDDDGVRHRVLQRMGSAGERNLRSVVVHAAALHGRHHSGSAEEGGDELREAGDRADARALRDGRRLTKPARKKRWRDREVGDLGLTNDVSTRRRRWRANGVDGGPRRADDPAQRPRRASPRRGAAAIAGALISGEQRVPGNEPARIASRQLDAELRLDVAAVGGESAEGAWRSAATSTRRRRPRAASASRTRMKT